MTDELERGLAAILTEARAQVAAGRDPNIAGLEVRITTAVRRARAQGVDPVLVDTAEADVRRRLGPIASVHRARGLVARDPAPAPKHTSGKLPVSAARWTTPAITGNLDVRRAGDAHRLTWDALPAVTEWEVRFSERPDVRSEYVERGTIVLAAGETSIDVPLGDNPFRVNILGRGRGKVQRRALISGLTREGWRSRWQIRP